MGFKRGQNPHHPRKGSSIKVEPIRDLNAIARIKENLQAQGQFRNLCLFTMGINTAWRCGELLSIKLRDVLHLKEGDMLRLKQSKTGEYRYTPINREVFRVLRLWLAQYAEKYPRLLEKPNSALFLSNRRVALKVPSVINLVKKWCAGAGLFGRYASHTLRKTWGYQQRVTFNKSIEVISEAFGHSSVNVTRAYIGILREEVRALYKNEI
ncbi:MAG: integrase [Arenicella sp.]|jgi:integrase